MCGFPPPQWTKPGYSHFLGRTTWIFAIVGSTTWILGIVASQEKTVFLHMLGRKPGFSQLWVEQLGFFQLVGRTCGVSGALVQ